MGKTTDAADYSAYVRTLNTTERLFLLGQLACAEAIARTNRIDVETHHRSTEGLPEIVRSHVMASVYSARRALERIQEKYERVALTL